LRHSHVLVVLLSLAGSAGDAVAEGQAERQAATAIAGPVEARVVKVHDGDSFSVDALVWPGTSVSVSIRVRGIDAPELRSKCPHERWLARQSRAELAERLALANVHLRNIGGDKYYGRVLADVTLADGSDLAQVLLENRLARPYGGERRKGWCSPVQY
jgi:endonuclease YncB( thermonuclease family)